VDDPLYIGIRFALYADLMLLFGLPLFSLYTFGGENSVVVRRSVLIGLSLLGLSLSALAIAAMTASMAGVAILDVDRGSISTMISDTPMGRAWAVRMAALALLAITLSAMRRPAVVALLAAIALGSLAWTGHGAAGEGNAGTVQLVGDLVHLLAAAAWLGALVGLLTMASANRDPAGTHRALDGFASIGTHCGCGRRQRPHQRLLRRGLVEARQPAIDSIWRTAVAETRLVWRDAGYCRHQPVPADP
jgi:copper resistance protein D